MKSRFLIIALAATGAICSYGQTVEQTPYGARIITPQTVTELQFFTPGVSQGCEISGVGTCP